MVAYFTFKPEEEFKSWFIKWDKKVDKRKEVAVFADFVTTDHREKIKEDKRLTKLLDLTRELVNMKVTMISIVVGALGTTPKVLVKKAVQQKIHKKNWEHLDHNIAKINSNTK